MLGQCCIRSDTTIRHRKSFLLIEAYNFPIRVLHFFDGSWKLKKSSQSAVVDMKPQMIAIQVLALAVDSREEQHTIMDLPCPFDDSLQRGFLVSFGPFQTESHSIFYKREIGRIHIAYHIAQSIQIPIDGFGQRPRLSMSFPCRGRSQAQAQSPQTRALMLSHTGFIQTKNHSRAFCPILSATHRAPFSSSYSTPDTSG